MSNNNNYLSNIDARLPTRVTTALTDFVAAVELEGAVVARHSSGQGDLAQHLGQLLRMVDQEQPARTADIRKRMGTALDLVDRAPRFRAFKGVSLTAGDVLTRVDLVRRHRGPVLELARDWVHIPPEVFGANRIERLAIDSRDGDDIVLPQAPYRGLRFHLATVRCIDETGGRLAEWLGGADEIYCGAVAVDENGNTSSGGLFKVRNFDDGDLRDYGYPGKSLQFFNLHEGGDTFPKIYTLALALVEHDFGNLPDWFSRLLDLVKDKVVEYLAALVGTAIGSPLGPLGALIGAAIGWAVGKVIGLVKSWLGDENLGTKTLTATINSYSGNWIDSGGPVSSLYTRDYRAHEGHYRVTWRCELVR